MSARHLYCLLFLLPLALCGTVDGGAQTRARFSVGFRDSLRLDEGSSILNGMIRLTNTQPRPLNLRIRLALPTGWREIMPVGRETIEVPADSSRVLAINLLRTQRVLAGWDTIRVTVWDEGTGDTLHNRMLIAVKAQPDFEVTKLSEELHLAERPQKAIFKASLRNSGNVEDEYIVSFNSDYFELRQESYLRLSPGQDTTVEAVLAMSVRNWEDLYAQNIYFSAISKLSGKTDFLVFAVSRGRAELKQNKSSFKSWPISFGGGLILLGSELSYFGQFKGRIRAGAHSLLFSYRSKAFGDYAYSYQNHVFSLAYNYKGLSVEAGQVSGPRNFFTMGQGLSISYRKPQGLNATISAMKYVELEDNYRYRSNNVFGHVDYPLGKVAVLHRVESNFDVYYKINSYLLNNEIRIAEHNGLRFSANIGAGMEDKQVDIPGIEKLSYGPAGGYNLELDRKRIHVSSTAQLYDKNYPGVYKGMQTQYHLLSYDIAAFRVGLTYISNYMERNTLRDTLYSTDYLRFNNSRYGLVIALPGKSLTGQLKLGRMDQVGGVSTGLNDAEFADLDVSWKLGKQTLLSLNTANAFRFNTGSQPDFVTNSRMQFNSKIFGFNFAYNKVPQLADDTKIEVYQESVYGGPNLNFSLFRNTLVGSIRYTLAKNSSERAMRTGVGANINYHTRDRGFTISLNGFYPLKDPTGAVLPYTERRFGSIYLLKNINVPVKRLKVYNLKATLFEDLNNNRQPDEGEPLLSNASVTIDDKSLTTGADGIFKYRNVNPGVYRINFVQTSQENLIPTDGIVQTVSIQDHTELLIPFRRGEKIAGNLHIDLDSFSTVTLSPGNFRIIFKDTSDRIYNTLTDGEGNFYSYLPVGNYTVSLNPEAFAGSDFKPEKMSYNVRLVSGKEAFVQFIVHQKKRKVRFNDFGKSR